MQINLEHINTENLALGTKPIETEVQVLLIITFFDKPINHYPPGPRIQQKAKFSWISINLQSSPISNNNSKQTSSFIRKVENNREKREREKQWFKKLTGWIRSKIEKKKKKQQQKYLMGSFLQNWTTILNCFFLCLKLTALHVPSHTHAQRERERERAIPSSKKHLFLVGSFLG